LSNDGESQEQGSPNKQLESERSVKKDYTLLPRLSESKIYALMARNEIPYASNECINRLLPLAYVDGSVRCVRGTDTVWCVGCPFYARRAWGVETSDKPLLDIEMDRHTVTTEEFTVSFNSKIREMRRDAQYMITLPMEVVDKANLKRFVGVTVRVTLATPVTENKGQ
jgi:hypothetical protein